MTELLSVEITNLAARHIRQAEKWWRLNRTAAPNAVREELERVFPVIAAQPRIGARARDLKLKGVRRVHLARITYDVYYREVESPRRLQILALWHSRRGKLPPI